DVRTLDPAKDFSVEIETAIAAARAIVLCITPSLDRQDSFVRREILYAQAKQRQIIPIRVANAAIPVLVAHLTYIEASLDSDSDVAAMMEAVVRRLGDVRRAPEVRDTAVGRTEYLRALYDEIVTYLDQTVHKLVTLTAVSNRAEGPPRRALPATFRSVVLA